MIANNLTTNIILNNVSMITGVNPIELIDRLVDKEYGVLMREGYTAQEFIDRVAAIDLMRSKLYTAPSEKIQGFLSGSEDSSDAFQLKQEKYTNSYFRDRFVFKINYINPHKFLFRLDEIDFNTLKSKFKNSFCCKFIVVDDGVIKMMDTGLDSVEYRIHAVYGDKNLINISKCQHRSVINVIKDYMDKGYQVYVCCGNPYHKVFMIDDNSCRFCFKGGNSFKSSWYSIPDNLISWNTGQSLTRADVFNFSGGKPIIEGVPISVREPGVKGKHRQFEIGGSTYRLLEDLSKFNPYFYIKFYPYNILNA